MGRNDFQLLLVLHSKIKSIRSKVNNILRVLACLMEILNTWHFLREKLCSLLIRLQIFIEFCRNLWVLLFWSCHRSKSLTYLSCLHFYLYYICIILISLNRGFLSCTLLDLSIISILHCFAKLVLPLSSSLHIFR